MLAVIVCLCVCLCGAPPAFGNKSWSGSRVKFLQLFAKNDSVVDRVLDPSCSEKYMTAAAFSVFGAFAGFVFHSTESKIIFVGASNWGKVKILRKNTCKVFVKFLSAVTSKKFYSIF